MRRSTSFLGVLGWPLDHTLSPVVHNAAFRRLGLDWTYLAFPVPPERLGTAIEGLRALGALGANVTMPHKETVIEHLDEMSGDARAIGAVNTIQTIGDRLIGHNTDVDGFSAFLSDDAGLDVRDWSCVVLGAGGAARAVVKSLEGLGAGEITVVGRRPEQLDGFDGIAPDLRFLSWDQVDVAAGAGDLVVNATPLGMQGEDPLPGTTLREDQVVVDLVYDPPQTPLVEKARAAGAAGWGGLGMLVHQAAASLRLWSGQEAPVEAMSVAAMHALSRH